MDFIRDYIEEFNRCDEECYGNAIPNRDACDWIIEQVPHLRCPDKVIERAYYFRWWTYRKHLRKTPDGWVVTEFLPDVPWARKHNTINAAAGHHVAEGKWLRGADTFLNDYIAFYLNGIGDAHSYSSWLLSAAREMWDLRGDSPLDAALLDKCTAYYEKWEAEHRRPCGLFWSIDDRDAMEYTISGTRDGKHVPGFRPTLNSYMVGEARAIADFAARLGHRETAGIYAEKAEALAGKINAELYRGGFYYPRTVEIYENGGAPEAMPREITGYIPWWFEIPAVKDGNGPDGRAFDWLLDEKVFWTPYGLTTAEQGDPRFLFPVRHACLWNGYIWPFSTSQTLNALLRFIRRYGGGKKYSDMYLTLLHQYAATHNRITEDGRRLDWIDESRSPLKDEWYSRERLKEGGWTHSGGYERGKDYNHSTFCDLVLSFLCEVKNEGGRPDLVLRVPDGWDYLDIENLYIGGKEREVHYRKP